MEAGAFRFSSIGRHIEQHQPHSQDLPRPLALLHGIHQQDATQPLALVPPVDSEVAEKNAWNQVRSRCPRGSIGGHVSHANGMGIDGVKARQARGSPAWAASVAT
ncbi:hypothetical protein SYNGFB01_12200 [Synechococcus sp. GFB01]|nr:hypothetical protein SYNGFB01_12200 [Synechococcus sp. GFB01]